MSAKASALGNLTVTEGHASGDAMVGGLFVSVHGPLDSEEDFKIKANFIGAATIAHEKEELVAAQVAGTPELISWADRPGHTSPVQVPAITQEVYGTKSGVLLDKVGVQQ